LFGGVCGGGRTPVAFVRYVRAECRGWLSGTGARPGRAGPAGRARGGAVADIKRVAFGTLMLHRIEAGTLKHNIRSRRVLERNGFERFGLAPDYLRIDGRWQGHVMFQVINATGRC
jgi:RimJ/RimL family protein N-acetyltransferase